MEIPAVAKKIVGDSTSYVEDGRFDPKTKRFTAEVQLKAATQTAEATLARYRAGFGSLLDLITAQVDESNARVQRIQSYLDWYTALARLNFSTGVSDIMTVTGAKK